MPQFIDSNIKSSSMKKAMWLCVAGGRVEQAVIKATFGEIVDEVSALRTTKV